jgi:hypothetical protein
MVAVLATCAPVLGTDARSGGDFLQLHFAPNDCDAVITNPPYQLAPQFIDHALCLMEARRGMVAMLLRTDFDHAASRRYLFESNSFCKKLVLTKRIRWFAESKGSPSFNHAWYLWSWKHRRPATIALTCISARRFSRSSTHYRPQLSATATNNLLAA